MNLRQGTQCMTIYRYMQEHGQITARDAMGFGCYRLAARIADLKRRGVSINTEIRRVDTANGMPARIAVYSIIEE